MYKIIFRLLSDFLGGCYTTLELMSAEILPQHVHPFEDAKLKAHFSQQEWYRVQAVEDVEGLLSSFEVHNLDLIRERYYSL